MNNEAQSATVKARLARDLAMGPPAGRLELPVSVINIHGSVVNNIDGSPLNNIFMGSGKERAGGSEGGKARVRVAGMPSSGERLAEIRNRIVGGTERRGSPRK